MGVIQRVSLKHFIPDIIIMVSSLYLSLALRVDVDGTAVFLPTLNKLIPVFILIRTSTFIFEGVYDILWRYISMSDAIRLLRATLVSTLLFMVATLILDIGRLPRSIFLIDTVVCFLLLTGVRASYRLYHERRHRNQTRAYGRRTLIYGASTHGHTLVQRFHSDSDSGFQVLGFIDDNPKKTGYEIAGIKVLGGKEILERLLDELKIQELVVAIAQPPVELVRHVIQVTKARNIKPRMVSHLWHEDKKGAKLDILRTPDLSDLLQRPKRVLDHSTLSELVKNKTVLISGAGGSIGSELTRQIFNYGPARLLLVDHNEFNLYQIDHALRVAPVDDSVVVPILMDLRDRDLLQSIVREYKPDLVFHAAAYKHVHLTEANPYSAIINNIEGTKNILEISEEFNVQRFVLISTDKAVNPAGVMGATKRICELMVNEVGRRAQRDYCAVRFGNVLGSSGSLIPLLQKQILNNEPVTITHQDMARYFMLIPEAVSLVLKAATLCGQGDIMILRMGDPIKIVDIARSLITLLGKSEAETPIVITGIRPGEKIVEELYLNGTEIETSDPDVLILPKGDSTLSDGKMSLMNRIDILLIQSHGASRECLHTMNQIIQSAQENVPEAKFLAPKRKIQY